MLVMIMVITLMTYVIEMMEMVSVLMVVSSGKSVSLLTGLLFSGHYDHIIGRSVNHYFWMLLYPDTSINPIARILECLNATQLACLQRTCKAWHEYIEDNLWRDAKVFD